MTVQELEIIINGIASATSENPTLLLQAVANVFNHADSMYPNASDQRMDDLHANLMEAVEHSRMALNGD
jgi:hypothetical protein